MRESSTMRRLHDNARKGAHLPKMKQVSRKPRVYQGACRDCDWLGTPGTGNQAYTEMEEHSRATSPRRAQSPNARRRRASSEEATFRWIQIEEALDQAAEKEAARRKISKAALIRKALAHELNGEHRDADPWEALTGWLDDAPVQDLDDAIYDRPA